ncbi:cyclic nucleotide-binding-like protein, partial [Spinellus fusiger]
MVDITKGNAWSGYLSNNELSIPPELLMSLRKHSLFQLAGNDYFLQQLACCMHLRNYEPQENIILEGEAAKAMFFILRGSVDVCSADHEHIYATLRQGSCFGEIGIFYSMPRTATVIAKTKCSVAVLMAEDVATMLPHFPQAEQMLRYEAEERLALLRNNRAEVHDAMNLCQNNHIDADYNIDCLEKTSTHEKLRKIFFLKDSPYEFLHQISLYVKPRHYPPNVLIYQKGDPGTEMFFIIDGTVELRTKGPNEKIIPRLGAGDSFGEIAILLDIPRVVDAQTITHMDVYALDRKDFLDVCHQYPELTQQYKTVASGLLDRLEREVNIQRCMEGLPFVPNTSNASITVSSVCSTTSDQDPTLPIAASSLRKGANKRRRDSVAVWADPALLAMVAEKEKAMKAAPVESTITHDTQFVDLPQQQKSKIHLLGDEVLGYIFCSLDVTSIVCFASTSHHNRHMLKRNPFILKHLQLSPYNKRITDISLSSLVEFAGERVKSLDLSHCFHITDSAIRAIA